MEGGCVLAGGAWAGGWGDVDVLGAGTDAVRFHLAVEVDAGELGEGEEEVGGGGFDVPGGGCAVLAGFCGVWVVCGEGGALVALVGGGVVSGVQDGEVEKVTVVDAEAGFVETLGRRVDVFPELGFLFLGEDFGVGELDAQGDVDDGVAGVVEAAYLEHRVGRDALGAAVLVEGVVGGSGDGEVVFVEGDGGGVPSRLPDGIVRVTAWGAVRGDGRGLVGDVGGGGGPVGFG